MSRRLTLIAAVITVIVFTAAQSLLFNFSDAFSPASRELSQNKIAPPPPPAPVVYGIPTDSLEIVEGVVESGETLSTLLEAYNIPSTTVHDLAQKAKGVHNVRALRRGRGYTLLHTSDAARTARYLSLIHILPAATNSFFCSPI